MISMSVLVWELQIDKIEINEYDIVKKIIMWRRYKQSNLL